MSCVSSVQYQVLINGTPYGHIEPTRGLRQGDPLSPYLFVMCTEMLVQRLKKAENEGQISGLQVARGAPPVSHLLFADDSMLYCKGDSVELDRMIQVLHQYSLLSGQQINYQKSSVYFGKRIPQEKRQEIMAKLKIDKLGGDGIYLGLPEAFGESKVSVLQYLKENLNKKMQGWQMKFLSPGGGGGKEILLKAVAMALPTYTMSCFLLPKTICKQIMSLMSEFWWKETRGMHWTSWEAMCKPKECGGLGFKDLEAFNLALLGKQLWRMIINKNSLLARIYKSRYFKNTDPLNAKLGSRPLYAWRSIHAAQKLIQAGARVIIGNGKGTKLWQERWLNRKPASKVQSMKRQQSPTSVCLADDMKVSELLQSNGRDWNTELIEELFSEEVRDKIYDITPAGKESDDSYAWDYTKTGHYTVKSGYWVQVNIINARQETQEILQPGLDVLYQMIWKLETSPKIHPFLWRCLKNSLPVAGNMYSRHISKDSRCIRCGQEDETVNHLLFTCPYARLIWAMSPIHAPPQGTYSNSLYTNLHWVLNLKKEYPNEEVYELLVPWLLWRIRKNRNEYLFRGKDYSAHDTIQKAKEDEAEWRGRNEAEVVEVKHPLTKTAGARWKPPPNQWLMCNSDGAWRKESRDGGVGWVLRNNQGLLSWIGAKKVRGMN